MNIKFELLCGLVKRRGPKIALFVNGSKFKSFIPTRKKIQVEIDVDDNQDNIVSFVIKGKKDHDTIVTNNKIVADKFLRVCAVWIDDVLLNEIFYYGQVNFFIHELSDNQKQNNLFPTSANCLYLNGKLEYKFNKNFFNWYHEHLKQQDLKQIVNHKDSEANEKYLGYNQESTIANQILNLLSSHGYSVTC
jgi:hypothetical protein